VTLILRVKMLKNVASCCRLNLTVSNVQIVAENLCGVVDEFTKFARTVVMEMCTTVGIHAENVLVKQAVSKL
jgi:hypothetical protein